MFGKKDDDHAKNNEAQKELARQWIAQREKEKNEKKDKKDDGKDGKK